MNESEVRNLIRHEVRSFLTQVMLGEVVSNESEQRSTARRTGNEGPISKIRNIQPFGISSRAPAGTGGVLVPVNGDPTHLLLMGHFDTSKPACDDGDTILYDAHGNKISLINGEIKALTEKLAVISSTIKLGSEGSSNPLVLGDLLMEFLSDLLDLIIAHDHYGNLGFPTSPPRNAANFTAKKSSPVNDGTLVSGKSFTEK